MNYGGIWNIVVVGNNLAQFGVLSNLYSVFVVHTNILCDYSKLYCSYTDFFVFLYIDSYIFLLMGICEGNW